MLAVIPLSESVTAHSCLCEHNQQMAHTDRFPSPRRPKTKSNSWLLGCTQRLSLKLIRRSEWTGNETNCCPPSVALLPLFFCFFLWRVGKMFLKGAPRQVECASNLFVGNVTHIHPAGYAEEKKGSVVASRSGSQPTVMMCCGSGWPFSGGHTLSCCDVIAAVSPLQPLEGKTTDVGKSLTLS